MSAPARTVKPPLRSEQPEPVAQLELASGDYLHDFAAERSQLAQLSGREIELARFELSGVRLAQSQIDRLELTDGVCTNCDFAGVRWARPRIERVVFSGCRFTGAQLREVSALDVSFVACQLRLASITESSLVRCSFESCDLSEASFHRSTVKGTTIISSDLTRSDLSDAKFATTLFAGENKFGGLSGLEALKGAELEWLDLVELAPQLAGNYGIKLARQR